VTRAWGHKVVATLRLMSAALLLALTAARAAPVGLAEAVIADRHIQDMVNQVSADTLWKHISQLSGREPVVTGARLDTLLTRYSFSWRIDRAADYLKDRLGSYLDDVVFYPYAIGTMAFYSLSFTDSRYGWVVGNDNAAYMTQDGGLSWERREVGTPHQYFWGVSFVDHERGWVCGVGGTIYRTGDGGETWVDQSPPRAGTLREIRFIDPLEGWVVGDGGLIMHTTDGGGTWVKVESGTTANLYGLTFRSKERGWTCGSGGIVLSWDGARWDAQDTGTAEDLAGIDFGDDDSGWAVGGNGTILRTDTGGAVWVPQAVPEDTNPFLKGVAAAGPSEAWVIGLNGTILHSQDGGATWHDQASNTLFGLTRIRVTGPSEVWVAGYGSTILYTKDGGATWESRRKYLPEDAVVGLKDVVGTLPGTASDSQVIICGHFDSISDDPYNVAPGADDNATGTAAVMEAARILSGYRFERTIKFICFSGEEQGLFGSGEYIADRRSAGDKIVGVINFDMIGYADVLPEDIDVVGNSESEWLADVVVDCARTYVPSLEAKKIIDPAMVYSDHASFWKAGYYAVLGVEDIDTPYPYYHTTADTLGNLDEAFATDVVRMGVAAVAHLARPDTTSPEPKPRAEIRIVATQPNPFSAEIGIRFSISTDGEVETTVVDVGGRRVKRLTSGPLLAGKHTVTWNGRDERGKPAAPGIYFVRVGLGNERAGSKIVLVR
jgi:photosystem II stability/assembly factor-like uncharacterized protein